jgi:hypothetical protein
MIIVEKQHARRIVAIMSCKSVMQNYTSHVEKSHAWHITWQSASAERSESWARNTFSASHRVRSAKPAYRPMQAIMQILIVSILSYASVMQNHVWLVWHRARAPSEARRERDKIFGYRTPRLRTPLVLRSIVQKISPKHSQNNFPHRSHNLEHLIFFVHYTGLRRFLALYAEKSISDHVWVSISP